MKRIIFILSVLILISLSGAMMYFSGLLFDASRKIEIEPYIFQPADLSKDRIGRPMELEKLSREYILERLINRFMREYFDVIPDDEELRHRSVPGSVLRAMTDPATPVLDNWNMNVRPELARLAEARKLRRTRVTNLRLAGEYYVVSYDLITYNPNDVDSVPLVQHNRQIQLRLRFEQGVRDTVGGVPFDAGKFLESGGDPAAIFKFVVEEVR
ncbi:MAG: hypothetical protein FWG80_00540 [Alphaproteobacteria bacterium]|nr:hypothetical protein [Alphaproteobacteria bacterium]